MGALDRPETWQALCANGNEEDRTSRMELYANYLDTVETHLLQEIAARSSHFFEAAGVVQDLRAALTRTFQQVAGLHQQACSPPCFLICESNLQAIPCRSVSSLICRGQDARIDPCRCAVSRRKQIRPWRHMSGCSGGGAISILYWTI